MYDPEQSLRRENTQTKIFKTLNTYRKEHPSCAPIYDLFGDLFNGVFEVIEDYQNCHDPEQKEQLGQELDDIKKMLKKFKCDHEKNCRPCRK